MNLLRDIRLLDKRPFPRGYEVTSSPHRMENQENPLLILKPKRVLFGDDLFPETLSIPVKVDPTLLVYSPNVMAQYHQSQRALNPVPLYHASTPSTRLCQHTQIRLRAMPDLWEDEWEKAPYRLLFPPQRILFEHSFITQTQSIQASHMLEKKSKPHWGYGGFFQQGCSFNDMEQILCSLYSENSTTALALKKMSQWRSASQSNRSENDCLQDMYAQEQLRSIGDQIRGGALTIRALHEDGASALYRSYGFREEEHRWILYKKAMI